MAVIQDQQAGYTAGNKFGLGLQPGELQQVGRDPRGWLQQQLTQITRVPAAYKELEASGVLLKRATEDLRETRKAVQAAKKAGGAEVVQPEKSGADSDTGNDARKLLAGNERSSQQELRQQLSLRMQVALTTQTPFAERLVRFWSNHFSIAAGGGAKKVLGEIAVPYENEAIRAHLGGRFAELLVAVEQHPAMLIYLDNASSIGPASMAGQRRQRGLNENLGREILELHSLGVNGGYSQQDVTSLAKIITGWTVGGLTDQRALRGEPGRFLFVPLMHEPGTQHLLGNTYRDDDVKQGVRALHDLATHPATARHIAFKLARHFIADQPPPAAVDELSAVFSKTGGDLPSVHAALIKLEAAWQPEQRKLKTPEELLISLGRGLDIAKLMEANQNRNSRIKNNFLLQALQTFAQVPFTAPSPAGWPDVADYWGGADALMKRIEWSTALAQRLGNQIDAQKLYPQLLPEQATLKQELARAESPMQALALLVASPQFQWRS